jgi:SAM-dependent methyltransferase
VFKAESVRRVIEIGCGTGHDAQRLAHAGFEVTALDFSSEAIVQAKARYGSDVEFVVADITNGFPYNDQTFDAAMANVSLHMFPDSVTRSIFEDLRRILRIGGLLAFHVNSLDDRPLRKRRRPVARELEPNYVLEQRGQTVRFFSRRYIEELLRAWEIAQCEHIEIADDVGQPFKRVWRVVARRLEPA